ncbi:MAG: hypothetical protein ACRDPT_03175 [Streptomycetales bacterium]
MAQIDTPAVLRRLAGFLESVPDLPAASVAVSTGCYTQMIQVCEPRGQDRASDLARVAAVNQILAALGAARTCRPLPGVGWHYIGEAHLGGLHLTVFTPVSVPLNPEVTP